MLFCTGFMIWCKIFYCPEILDSRINFLPLMLSLIFCDVEFLVKEPPELTLFIVKKHFKFAKMNFRWLILKYYYSYVAQLYLNLQGGCKVAPYFENKLYVLLKQNRNSMKDLLPSCLGEWGGWKMNCLKHARTT